MRADTLVRYAVASLSRHNEELGYRYYLTELVRLQAEGKTWGMDYLEFLDYEPPEERTAEEIVAEVVAKGGLTEVEDGPA